MGGMLTLLLRIGCASLVFVVQLLNRHTSGYFYVPAASRVGPRALDARTRSLPDPCTAQGEPGSRHGRTQFEKRDQATKLQVEGAR
jgi:hypothetical protein